MPRNTRYTDAQKAEAIALFLEHGLTEAARRTGIPEGTVSSWAHRGGHVGERGGRRAEAIEAARATFEQRRVALAHDLLDDCVRLRDQLFAPVTKRQVVTLSGGRDAGATADIVDVDLDQPTFADQKAIMTTIAIAVDKVQILSGGATQRTETIDTSPEHVTGLVDELAERRDRVA